MSISRPVSDHQALSAAETAHMLKLCAAQIEDALKECDVAVEKLLESFGAVIDDAQWFWRHTNENSPGGVLSATEPTMTMETTARSARLVARANAAIQALQFHDRLTQRLGHVRHSLTRLGEFVTDQERSSQPDHWQQLHESLGKLYRTREEVAVFEALTRTPVDRRERRRERRPDKRQEPPPPLPGSDIELF